MKSASYYTPDFQIFLFTIPHISKLFSLLSHKFSNFPIFYTTNSQITSLLYNKFLNFPFYWKFPFTIPQIILIFLFTLQNDQIFIFTLPQLFIFFSSHEETPNNMAAC